MRINVPTVIVEQGGKEIGRIVETPAGRTVEEDLVAILLGRPNEHHGRWEREKKLASGTYVTKDGNGKTRGSESFEVFATKDDGRLVHSQVVEAGGTVEVFDARDARHALDVLEITKRTGDRLERERYSSDGGKLTGSLRGSDSGIVEQTVALPKDALVSAPCAASEGQMPSDAAGRLEVYVASGDPDRPLGLLTSAECVALPGERVPGPAGEVLARHVARRSQAGATELWLDPQFLVPIKVKRPDGSEAVLTSYVRQPSS